MMIKPGFGLFFLHVNLYTKGTIGFQTTQLINNYIILQTKTIALVCIGHSILDITHKAVHV